MRLGYLLALSLVVSLAGCGGDDRGTLDDGGTDSGGGEAGIIDSGPDGGGDGGGDDGGADDGGSDMDSGLDGGTDAGTDAGDDGAAGTDAMTDATITLSTVNVYGNCMPSVPSDPIIAFWTVEVSGAAGDTATLVSAELTVTGGGTTVNQTLTVDEPTVSLAGGSGSQDQRKTDAEGSGSAGCSDDLCATGAASFSLELTYEVDGAMVDVTETGAYGCVY